MQTSTCKLTFCLIAFAVLVILNCDTNPGLEPIRSGIQGTITYSGEWPATPAEVRIVSAKKFPPTDLNDLIIGESIPVNSTSYPYTFYVKPGTYPLLGVAWRAQDASWDIISICGLYFSGSDSLSPGELIVNNNRDVVPDINIHVNRSRAHKVTDTKITGHLSFNGAWPDSVSEARVIATTRFSVFPSIVLPTLLDIAFSNSIPRDATEGEYTIGAYPGTFAAIGVLFIKPGQTLGLGDIAYSISVGGLNATPLVVNENETAVGPSFEIEFK
ncbi:hypothetical protein JW960_01015 [candidate division KSB1 bacterium]|nr:hypothetical protein [candidate division KSB1 bacterium]